MSRLLCLVLLLAASARADVSEGTLTSSLPEYHAQDANAAVVTDANLLDSERFWPYQVALTRDWRPSGRAQPLGPDASGVLVRVEASGMARVDFGRDGLYEVPVAATDLVSRANRIRLGELAKLAPNFLLAIAPRLVDSASDSLRPYAFASATEGSGFLCVFADPDSKGFASLAAALAPLHGQHGVLTILFPQGTHPDAQVRERLRSLKWPVPFVYDHLSEAYTRSLLNEANSPPTLLLQTKDGRVLFQAPARIAAVRELTAKLAEEF